MSKSHRTGRKAVGNSRINAVVITYRTAMTSTSTTSPPCQRIHVTHRSASGALYTSRRKKGTTFLSRINLLIRYVHTHSFNGPFSRTTRVGRYQKGKTNLDFTEAKDSEWQWHQLRHMQVCTSFQTDNHASTSPHSFFTGRMPRKSRKMSKPKSKVN